MIFHVCCMFLQSLSLNSFGWMYFVHDKWINSSMDGWYDEHLNDIQMDECHSSILISYLSTQSICIMIKNYIYYLFWSLWMPSTIGMTFISSISLLWPILWLGQSAKRSAAVPGQADLRRVRLSWKSGFSACQVLWNIVGRSASRAAVSLVAHMIVKTLASACLLLEVRWQKGRQADK